MSRAARTIVKKVLSVEQAEGVGARVRRSVGRPEVSVSAVAPPMEPEMHYTRTILFEAEVVNRSWAVYFLFILSHIHKLFSTFITLVGHNRFIHQF